MRKAATCLRSTV